MGKGPEAPWGYQCPYRAACPHLQGLPAEWLWLRHQEDIEQAHELRKRIDQLVQECHQQAQRIRQLEQENTQLKAQWRARHQEQFKASKPDSTGTGSSPETPKEKKKRGAPKGHPPWTRRPPDHIDRTVRVDAPKECPHCHNRALQPCAERSEHLQEDIVLCPRTHVICFDHEQAWCPQCRRPVQQAAPGELIGSSIGPIAKSTSAYLHHGVGLSCRNVQKIMTELFGLPMVPASVLGFERAACARAQSIYEDLHQKIQASAYLHADETHWRVEGQNWWLWYAGHEELAFFHIDPHRSGAAAQTVIGPHFEGILNTDDYAAYNLLDVAERQSCLAHPLRLVREAEKLLTNAALAQTVDQRSQRFLRQAGQLLKDACQSGRQLRDQEPGFKASAALQAGYERRLKRLCARELSWEHAEQLRARLWKQRQNLFTFLRHPEVQPTNNQAEQSLRRSVILRKVTFGNRSEAGAQRQALLSSLLTTAQRQQRDARAALEQLWTQPLEIAQQAFYRAKPSVDSRRKPRRTGRRKPNRRASTHRAGRDPPLRVRNNSQITL